MTNQELEIILTERVRTFELEKIAFDTLQQIFSENSRNKDFLRGFTAGEIIRKLDGFYYRIARRHGDSVITTRIGLYVENQPWPDQIEPIGHYTLEANLNGELVDDWLVIVKEKYLKDIHVIAHFQAINEKLPLEYLNSDHDLFAFVTFISMAGTLFASKQYENSGQFIIKAYNHLETVHYTKFDKDYLWRSLEFLKKTSDYLTTNNLVSSNLQQELINYKDIWSKIRKLGL